MLSPQSPQNYEISLPAFIAGALTLTGALAWNEAAKTGIQSIYPEPTKGTFRATFIYALIVTLIIIVVFAVLRAATRATNHGSFCGTPWVA